MDLNLLRSGGFSPVLRVRDYFLGLEFLLLEPNAEDPMPGTSHSAAVQLRSDSRGFARKAREWMQGNYID